MTTTEILAEGKRLQGLLNSPAITEDRKWEIHDELHVLTVKLLDIEMASL